MLTVTHLEFDYGDKPVLMDISFTVNQGCLLHIQGANGCGKSTLLKVLAGLLTPTAGKMTFTGSRSYIGHKLGVNHCLTPREHWQYDLRPHPTADLLKSLEQLALTQQADTPLMLFSAGQQRRVGLLRLLANPVDLWLLDEPLVSLDAQGIAVLSLLMQTHLAGGGQIILSSHQPLPFSPPQLHVVQL
jgi:heme exporter protein A